MAKGNEADERAARLARELRKNLHRRKARARAQSQVQAENDGSKPAAETRGTESHED